MKTLLILPLACTALLLTGCHTYQGAAVDTYETDASVLQETVPHLPPGRAIERSEPAAYRNQFLD